MWVMKTEIIPVVLGALLGLTKKRLEKHMDKIPGAINIKKTTKNNFIRNSPQTDLLSALFCHSTMVWT